MTGRPGARRPEEPRTSCLSYVSQSSTSLLLIIVLSLIDRPLVKAQVTDQGLSEDELLDNVSKSRPLDRSFPKEKN